MASIKKAHRIMTKIVINKKIYNRFKWSFKFNCGRNSFVAIIYVGLTKKVKPKNIKRKKRVQKMIADSIIYACNKTSSYVERK